MQTNSIDALVGTHKYPIPDFIKIDIEGGEIAALNGAELTISNHRPKLLVATHGNTEHEFVLKFLDAHRYRYEMLNESATKGDTEIMAWPTQHTA